ncbi:serine/threonine-protein kinase [Kitasatospora viridis]|uniref:non-specific serine/threonine protein kinase n=1 Tax=Kitasatospora viridis TaxID=281105 RepID=A0A561UJI5_9ACTN|nr:serine/threonine-protein kinase [Kitasatospora viridis]TWF99528.1 serine/threonine protein kinase [Kitasatospora viridis]
MSAQQQEGTERRMLAGRYALGERLGRGGMGTVWRAQDLMLDREVAVKELTVNHLPEEDLAILQSRMKQEARAAARIKHSGVITIHDVLEQDGRPWIVMELIDGRSLADVIAQDGPVSPRSAAEVGAQVLAALHRGHQLGVLHRDVKPANVLLEHGTGRVVLLDFGIAKFEGSSELTRPGDLVGSPDYLAPERAQGERFGPASDLWGLGATLYAAVEGSSPFRRDTPLSTLAAVVDEPLPESSRAGALGPVLAALMAKEPAERPSAEEALRMLRAVTEGHTLGMAVPQQPHRVPTQAVPAVDRRPLVEEQEPAPEPVGVPVLPMEPVDPSAATGAHGPLAAEAVTAPVAVPPAAPRRRRGLRLGLVGLVVVLLAAGGVVYGLERDRHQPAPVADSTPTPQPGGSSAPSPSTGTQDSPGTPPVGYKWVDDEQGFRFPLPADGQNWVRTVGNGNNVYYTADKQYHLIQFSVTAGELGTPLDHLKSMEVTESLRKDYHVLSEGETQLYGQPAAKWVWTFTCGTCGTPGPRKVFWEEFKGSDGTAYAMLVSGPLSEATAMEQRFTAIVNNFKVIGHPGGG